MFFTFPWVSFYFILHSVFHCGQTSPLTTDVNIEAFFSKNKALHRAVLRFK